MFTRGLLFHPQIGFGTWRLTEKADESVYNAIKLGYRHIDCATGYDNQDQVGKGFARAFKDGGRSLRSVAFLLAPQWQAL